MWLLALFACQAPFGTDRHDLVGTRVAAISLPRTAVGAHFEPRLALIHNDHPWSDELPSLSWHWIEAPEDARALTPISPASAVGPRPDLTVPEGSRWLALQARWGQETRLAVAEVPSPGWALPPIDHIELSSTPWDLETVSGEALALQARRAASTAPAEQVDEGAIARLEAVLNAPPQEEVVVRWMATAGTFLELDNTRADWAAGHLLLDGLEVKEARAMAPGPVTVIALALSQGETTWRATDLHVGEPPQGVWVSGRWFPTDRAAAPGSTLEVTLVLDDEAPSGLAFHDLSPARPGPPWGTETLPCAYPLEGPFDPSWLLDGSCARERLAGSRIVVQPDEGP